ncbi:MAG: ABC transporter ATP-binding protein [Clostridiales Family XIII bacterium]|jgi:simple sugar transport system ATP-binding protein|nr:ABC transporter ATP-binding protein [Clostridiales Family XIII bacterium]
MEYAFEMLGITKKFPGIVANDNITLQVRPQEVHALLGENGAGKSTLMNVLFGLYHPEEGEIRIKGTPARIMNPGDANRRRIGMVHQHFKLVQNFTALENIILGAETTRGAVLKMDKARKRVVEIAERYKFNIDPDMPVEDMTVGMQQRVEIMKMLYRENEILIFDEPTAVLTPQEVDELMKIIRGLTEEGKSIVFISHKLNEIFRIADRCTVLRRGKSVGVVDIEGATKEELCEMMVGRKVLLQPQKTHVNPGDVLMEVKNLTVAGVKGHKDTVRNVSFNVRAGEIVCIAGIDGNGQTELVYGLTGMRKIESGSMVLDGRNCTKETIHFRNTHKLSHIPEDRHKHGLVLDYTLAENMILQTFFERNVSRCGIIDYRKASRRTDEMITKYDIRTARGPVTRTRSMSGGNQQKAIVARELERDFAVVIAVQPTRGMDVGAIEFIHKQLLSLRDMGKGVLLVSLELEEVMNISDRILVMYEGEIVGELLPDETDFRELGLYMAGAKRSDGRSEGGTNG